VTLDGAKTFASTSSLNWKFVQKLPIEWVIRWTSNNAIFPLYHTVSDDVLPHLSQLYDYRSSKQFVKDLDFLLKHYQPMDLQDLREYKKHGKRRSRAGFFLTFDDGLAQFYDVIAPILLRKGIPAACFINSSFVDNKDLMYRYKVSLILHTLKDCVGPIKDIAFTEYTGINDYQILKKWLLDLTHKDIQTINKLAAILGIDIPAFLEAYTPYMTEQQIKKVIADGFYIGSHSMDHPRYDLCTLEEQLAQTKMSMDYVKEKFTQPFDLFAFPFSDVGVSYEFFRKCQGMDATFGTSGIKNDPLVNHFHRIPMEISDFDGETIIKNQYFYYMCKAMIGKNTIKRR